MVWAPAAGSLPVAVLLLENFSMICFASTVEPLREANYVAKYRAYDWRVISPDGQAVRASNGLTVSVDGSIEDVPHCPMVIVCSSFDPHLHVTPKILAWLRKLDRQGSQIGGVETGTYVLARAGLAETICVGVGIVSSPCRRVHTAPVTAACLAAGCAAITESWRRLGIR